MKTIGLIGGMSWQSTLQYYRLLNEGAQKRLGGSHSAKLVLANVDFAVIEALQHAGDWESAGQELARYARSAEAGGAEVLLIGANTMHRVAPAVEAAIRIPLLHVADATADAVVARGCRRPGLLGTRFTMEQPFYRERLHARRQLPVMVPVAEDRSTIHRIIYEELCHGLVSPESRSIFQGIIGRLVEEGADSIILGCTEIPMLIGPADVSVPVFDTTAIHVDAALEFAMGR